MKLTCKIGERFARFGLIFTLIGPVFSQNSDVPGKTAPGASATKASPRAADVRFAKEAAVGSMTEVELGKIVASKASTDKVRQFAERVFNDHSKAVDQLQAVAAKENVTLPTELDAKHKAMVDKYSRMPAGPAFDRTYIADMVRDHDADIAAFQREAESGTDAGFRDFAAMNLPALQEHVKMAKDTEGALSATLGKSK